MRFVRFRDSAGGAARQGIIEDGVYRGIVGDIFGEWKATEERVDPAQATLLAPWEPATIVGIANNYVPAGQVPPPKPELPALFLKPGSSVIGPGEAIVMPAGLEEVKFEAELVAVIGREARNVSEKDALSCVFGYTVGNDVTAPQYFHPLGPWMAGKSYDTFTPLGPVLVQGSDPSKYRVESMLNGELKQSADLGLMIMNIAEQIAFLSSMMTLRPGDAIFTGAPDGASMMRRGDTIACMVPGIGRLVNAVA